MASHDDIATRFGDQRATHSFGILERVSLARDVIS
jgi:hypothetical protein